ncbi:hypothetical protein pb186bvf_000808 [Paramecium bursaria]
MKNRNQKHVEIQQVQKQQEENFQYQKVKLIKKIGKRIARMRKKLQRSQIRSLIKLQYKAIPLYQEMQINEFGNQEKEIRRKKLNILLNNKENRN